MTRRRSPPKDTFRRKFWERKRNRLDGPLPITRPPLKVLASSFRSRTGTDNELTEEPAATSSTVAVRRCWLVRWRNGLECDLRPAVPCRLQPWDKFDYFLYRPGGGIHRQLATPGIHRHPAAWQCRMIFSHATNNGRFDRKVSSRSAGWKTIVEPPARVWDSFSADSWTLLGIYLRT